METWKLLLLFIAAFGGGLAIFFVKSDKSNLLKLVLSFSGAYLFSITVLHLIPSAYKGAEGASIGLYILFGFMLQVFLEQFSEGVEHGHIHKHGEKNVFPVGIMFSLCLHAFLEGMPLANDPHNELIYGISIHHIPASFALASILMQNNFNSSKIMICVAVFAVMAPFGYFISSGINEGSILGLEAHFNKMMGVVIGIFLHISTTILFESSAGHKINKKKMIAVLLGMGIAIAGFLFSHQH
ncbi:ZIP family metal transporter [Pedobacter flavus]|uniref:ZIP family metal transporter n=1 Tax=Pedobacter flavus TaxID=3113906 RepID=A0ABU7H1N8_9SPHI|nr:ZIP family metal transporter [Pedobacter sp. VNH31]MEE1885236.1 ZIP family metal transporter [Pedobacter sp. VNH31]